MEMGPHTQQGGVQARHQKEGQWETSEGKKDREEGKEEEEEGTCSSKDVAQVDTMLEWDNQETPLWG